MKIYICLTYYHTLITVVKAILSGEKYDLYLANNIPNYEDLRERLESSNLFNCIYEYKEADIDMEMAPILAKTSDRWKNYAIRYFLPAIYEKYATVDLQQYADIYLYHDISQVGKYLIIKKFKFHLLEDALDYFKYFDQYYKVSPKVYKPGKVKYWLKCNLPIGLLKWGTAPDIIDIEVNDIDGIKIRKDKVFQVPRKELFGALSEEQKRYVYQIFASGKNIDANQGRAVLLCTQPLYTAHFVDTEEEQLRVFESVVKEYREKGYYVVLKPHPRDLLDYSEIIRRHDCGFIEKDLPSEVLNYNPDARYECAISITSTAINFLEYADQKVFMGEEYIKKVLTI